MPYDYFVNVTSSTYVTQQMLKMIIEEKNVCLNMFGLARNIKVKGKNVYLNLNKKNSLVLFFFILFKYILQKSVIISKRYLYSMKLEIF